MYNSINKNTLLGLIIFSYLIPILYIYSTYSTNPSISNNICHPSSQVIILTTMMIMGFFTILYEMHRDNHFSFICITLLLIGIYGVICIDEYNPVHYVFATIVLLSIMFFMINNYYIQKSNILLLLLVIQFILFTATIVTMETYSFFYVEAAFIINFALFYFYLHYVENI